MSTPQIFHLISNNDHAATQLQPGWRLLEASAGTGKTYTLAGLFVRILLEHDDIRCSEILVITFTKAATAELRTRIHALIANCLDALQGNQHDDAFVSWVAETYAGNEEALRRLKLAHLELDQASIQTIHSFCQQILSEYAFPTGRLLEQDITNQHDELDLEIATDFWRTYLRSEESIITTSLREINSQIKATQLAKLVAQCASHNHFKIDDNNSGSDVLSIIQSLAACHRDLNDLWPQARTELESYSEQKYFHGSSMFGAKKLAKTLTDIEYFLETGRVQHKDTREHITREFADAKLTKNKPSLESGFFDRADDLKRHARELKEVIHNAFLAYYQIEIEKRLEQHSICSHDDVIRWLANALNKQGNLGLRIGSAFKAAFIDECQDTDALQFDIFSAIFQLAQQHVYLIGDPKQSIYRFRGADVFSYLGVKERIEEQFLLNTNFRSDHSLIDGFNYLFSQQDQVFGINGIDYQAVDKRHDNRLNIEKKNASQIVLWDRETDENTLTDLETATALGNEILHLLEHGSINEEGNDEAVGCKDIAILVRNHFEGHTIANQLERMHIPVVQSGGQNIFASPEATELYYFLKACLSRHNQTHLANALSSILVGLDSDSYREEEALEFAQSKRRFHVLNDLWQEHGLLAMFQYFLATGCQINDENARERLLNSVRGERALINYLHLIECLHEYSIEHQCGPNQCMRFFEEQYSSNDQRSEELEIRLSTDEDAVQIMTIHKSKGLQFPIVFIPHANAYSQQAGKNRILNDYHERVDDNWVYRMVYNSSDNKSLSRTEDLSEQLRLFYVAVTRAEHRCYIGIAQSSDQCLALLNDEAAGDAHAFYQKLCKDKNVPLLWQQADSSTGKHYKQQKAESKQTNCPKPLSIYRAWSRTSYSGLIRNLDHSADHDIHIPTQLSSTDFPKGPQAGNCLHALFENIPFDHINNKELVDPIITEQLRLHAFDHSHFDAAHSLVDKTLNCPVPELNTALCTLSTDDYIPELEFVCNQGDVDSKSFYNCLKKYGDKSLQDYYQRLQDLHIPKGYLRGFIDLIFFADGRWHVLDWKSNALAAYDHEHMHQEMSKHDYIFQYHIYVLALHRLLRQRINGYDYERDIGNVYYAFIRGIDASHPTNGWYVQRPNFALIDALDQLLQEPAHA